MESGTPGSNLCFLWEDTINSYQDGTIQLSLFHNSVLEKISVILGQILRILIILAYNTAITVY